MSLRKILVVDDEEVMRRVLVRVLGRKGVAVLTAATGAEGVACTAREQPELILLDNSLEDGDGLQFVADLRRQAPSAGIILMSGFWSAPVEQDAVAAGALGFLGKPIEYSVLEHVLQLCERDGDADFKALRLYLRGRADPSGQPRPTSH